MIKLPLNEVISLENALEEIGKRIYELRNYLNMTQKELCEGICTQAYISKIENGSLAIAADILFQIADRLGVDVNYFYDSTNINRMDYLSEVELQAQDLANKRDFQSLYELILREEKTPLMYNKKFKQFILWKKGMCEKYVNNDLNKAIQLMNQALAITNTTKKTYSERELEIILSIAHVYVELKQFNRAIEQYKHVMVFVNRIPYLKNDNLKVGLYYSLSRVYLFLDNLDEAIKYAKLGIHTCTKSQSLFGLGYLYFILGRAYEDKQDYENALESFKKAKFIFELTENENLLIKILYNIQDVENSIIDYKIRE